MYSYAEALDAQIEAAARLIRTLEMRAAEVRREVAELRVKRERVDTHKEASR